MALWVDITTLLLCTLHQDVICNSVIFTATLKKIATSSWSSMCSQHAVMSLVIFTAWRTTLALDRKSCLPWASCQICKIAGCACSRIPACITTRAVTHVPWCMPGSPTRGFLWRRWWGKRSRHSRRIRNPQFYVSGKRPMKENLIENRQTLHTIFVDIVDACVRPSEILFKTIWPWLW